MSNAEQIRTDAAQGWANVTRDPNGLPQPRAFVGKPIERAYLDVAPGSVVGYDARGGVAPRARMELDERTLDLVTHGQRSQRVSPRDVGMNSTALAQLHMAVPLFAGDARRYGIDNGSEAARDLEITRAVVGRYGSDVSRLWTVGSHSAAFLRTVSRVAAHGGDAFNNLFVNSELTVMLPDLVEIEKLMPSARDVFPMRMLNAPGAVDYEFRALDRRARAEHTATFAGDAPTAAVTSTPIRRPLRWMRSGVKFSWIDIEQWKQARANGSPLPDIVALQTRTAREALLELENIDLFFGNTDLDITGLLSGNQGINTPNAVANFKNAADPEAAVQALLAGAKRVFTDRFRRDIVIGLGTRDYLYVTTATYLDANGSSAGKSIAAIALERGKDMGVTAILHIPELGFEAGVETYLLGLGYSAALAEKYAGGLAGKAVMLTMARSPEHARGIVGQDLMQFPPDTTSTETKIQMAMSTGGLEVRQPKALDIQPLNDPS